MQGSSGLQDTTSIRKQSKRKTALDLSTENPAERKRVLNVLAQRRYRQRKKQQQRELKTLVDTIIPDVTAPLCENENVNTIQSLDGSESLLSDDGPQLDGALTEEQGNVLQSFLPLDVGHPHHCNGPISNDPITSAQGQGFEGSIFDLDIDFNSINGGLSGYLQTTETLSSTFVDDRNLMIPELDVLRAALIISTQLRSADRLWDPQAASIFCPVQSPAPQISNSCSSQGAGGTSASGSVNVASPRSASASAGEDTSWHSSLPKNLRPTPAQLTYPHHPTLDLLPWPSVRTKLILMFSNVPTDLWPRHASDGSDLSVWRLAVDLEDGGVRVWGPDPSTEDSWEVTQQFVDSWWWALEPKILRNAERLRIGRGEINVRLRVPRMGHAIEEDEGLKT